MKPNRKRGRPAQSEKELTTRRAEIASIALRLFKEEGYASVSMRRLSKEVALTPMALYRYFPSKLDILSTLWAHILGEAFKRVEAESNFGLNAEDRLQRASTAYVTYWFDNVEHYLLVFMNSGVTNSDVTSFVSQNSAISSYEIFFEAVAEALKRNRDDARVKSTTDGLVCHLHGIMHSLITMPGYAWTAREKLVRQAVRSAIRDHEQ